jgi:ATP-dependent helicase/nuclease subunit B
MAEVSVTWPAGADPRVHIWGTLEARLQSADLLILGGLDEKVWPADTRTDPWLSRAMRTEIGLPPSGAPACRPHSPRPSPRAS